VGVSDDGMRREYRDDAVDDTTAARGTAADEDPRTRRPDRA
jgi:hypothetical protein